MNSTLSTYVLCPIFLPTQKSDILYGRSNVKKTAHTVRNSIRAGFSDCLQSHGRPVTFFSTDVLSPFIWGTHWYWNWKRATKKRYSKTSRSVDLADIQFFIGVKICRDTLIFSKNPHVLIFFENQQKPL